MIKVGEWVESGLYDPDSDADVYEVLGVYSGEGKELLWLRARNGTIMTASARDYRRQTARWIRGKKYRIKGLSLSATYECVHVFQDGAAILVWENPNTMSSKVASKYVPLDGREYYEEAPCDPPS